MRNRTKASWAEGLALRGNCTRRNMTTKGLGMRRMISVLVLAVFLMAVAAGYGQQETAFYRITSSTNLQVTAFSIDGTLVWSNAAVDGVKCTVHRATTLKGTGNWSTLTTVTVTNAVMGLRVFDPFPPEGMVLIPAGVNSGSDPDYGGYLLAVSEFYMDRTEVTKALWDEVYSWAVTNGYSFSNTGSGKASDHPVQMVSWYDCVTWCNARSEKDGRQPCYDLSDWSCDFTAAGYRLPTGEEWEYAARGGIVGTRFPWGDTITHDQANYYGYPLFYSYDLAYEGYAVRYEIGDYPYTNPVEAFQENGYGLKGMSGNVWEWCWDSDAENQMSSYRGGSWDDDADLARCHSEAWEAPNTAIYSGGFRAVCR